jgi:major membrane immunogen (membrane-anchored lipoprotein)
MKKLITAMLALSLVLLVGCGSDDAEGGEGGEGGEGTEEKND